MTLAFLNLGYTEIVIILVVAVLVFGGKLPEVAKNAGKWFFDIKRGINTLNRDIYSSTPPDYQDPGHSPGGYPADIDRAEVKNIPVDVDTPYDEPDVAVADETKEELPPEEAEAPVDEDSPGEEKS